MKKIIYGLIILTLCNSCKNDPVQQVIRIEKSEHEKEHDRLLDEYEKEDGKLALMKASYMKSFDSAKNVKGFPKTRAYEKRMSKADIDIYLQEEALKRLRSRVELYK